MLIAVQQFILIYPGQERGSSAAFHLSRKGGEAVGKRWVRDKEEGGGWRGRGGSDIIGM